MDLEAAFLAAALPEPVILLGQRLEPYSVGHELLLRRHNSPFLPGGQDQAEPGPIEDHLWMAVFICSQKFDEACAGLRAADLRKRIAVWKRKARRVTPEQVADKILELQRYIEAGSACPDVKTRKRFTSITPMGGPWLAALISNLLGRLHFGSFSQVMDCPYGLAQWLFCVWWEREGALTIRAWSEDEEMALVRAEAAKRGLELMRWDQAGPIPNN